MAQRPVFVPVATGAALVQEVPVHFGWHAGMAPSQKRKNVLALHERAAEQGLHPLLEISTKSEREVGRRLSAFNLRIDVDGRSIPLECAFQGSKVFEHGGPFIDLFDASSREAKTDPRLRQSGRLTHFLFEGRRFGLTPSTAFYDWLYIRALYPHREWLRRLRRCAGFTDIEFNPDKSINCQARACATFVALERRDELDEVIGSFERFSSALAEAVI